MRKKLQINIFQCVSGNSNSVGKFFHIETYITSDGLRTRICNGVWDDLIAAQKALELKEDLLNVS